MNPENEPTVLIHSDGAGQVRTFQGSTLTQRVLSLFALATDIAYRFLNESNLPGPIKSSLASTVDKWIVQRLVQRIKEMPEDEIRKQILIVRDTFIPYLLNDGPDQNQG